MGNLFTGLCALLAVVFGICLWASGIGVLLTLVGAFISLMMPSLLTVSFMTPIKLAGIWLACLVGMAFTGAYISSK